MEELDLPVAGGGLTAMPLEHWLNSYWTGGSAMSEYSGGRTESAERISL